MSGRAAAAGLGACAKKPTLKITESSDSGLAARKPKHTAFPQKTTPHLVSQLQRQRLDALSAHGASDCRHQRVHPPELRAVVLSRQRLACGWTWRGMMGTNEGKQCGVLLKDGRALQEPGPMLQLRAHAATGTTANRAWPTFPLQVVQRSILDCL